MTLINLIKLCILRCHGFYYLLSHKLGSVLKQENTEENRIHVHLMQLLDSFWETGLFTFCQELGEKN